MKLYRKKQRNPTLIDIENYKCYKNNYNRFIKNAENLYLENLFESCKKDIKLTWTNINGYLGRGKKNFSYPKQFFMGTKSFSDTEQIVNGFNDYLSKLV